jgi:hypothetical protein
MAIACLGDLLLLLTFNGTIIHEYMLLVVISVQ